MITLATFLFIIITVNIITLKKRYKEIDDVTSYNKYLINIINDKDNEIKELKQHEVDMTLFKITKCTKIAALKEELKQSKEELKKYRNNPGN